MSEKRNRETFPHRRGPGAAIGSGARSGSVPAKHPVGIIDIGSNSVRLVAYEARTRAPTPIFNEKVLCGLGRGLVTTGELPEEGVDRALKALRRFRILGEFMRALGNAGRRHGRCAGS